MILELVCVVAKEFSPMDLLEKLPETIIVLTVLVLQRGLEPRPLGRAPPESCPDGVAAVEIRSAAACHGRPETSLVVDRVVVVVLVQRVGPLTTESDEDEEIQDFPIGRLPEYFRWCGIASAGAELRISGPKAPVSA